MLWKLFKKQNTPEPNSICDLCFSLTYLNEGQEEICAFCNSELCAHSFYSPLSEFFEKHSVADLENMRDAQKAKLAAEKNPRRRFYVKDHLKQIERLIKMRKTFKRPLS